MDYTHVLYHANCPDGFGAAWAASLKLGKSAQYIPAIHGEPFPGLPTDARVVMLDMAYPPARHEELKCLVKSLTVVDHHKTALENLGGRPNVHINLAHSGAVLAWKHFHPGKAVPDLLRYVEDRDLWKFELPRSREVHAALSSYDRTFEDWSRVAEMNMMDLAREGDGILRLQTRLSKQLAREAFLMKIAGVMVPVVNCTAFGSEVGEAMNLMYPDSPFSAYYFEKEGIRCWSLRSQGKIDVEKIAKQYGGGGHPNAAGFTEPITKRREDK